MKVKLSISYFKATSVNNIHVEMPKLLNDDNLKRFTHSLNQIYFPGTLASDWSQSIYISLPKKKDVGKCSQYRFKRLKIHILKRALRTIR